MTNAPCVALVIWKIIKQDETAVGEPVEPRLVSLSNHRLYAQDLRFDKLNDRLVQNAIKPSNDVVDGKQLGLR